jgi:hypothetical protein
MAAVGGHTSIWTLHRKVPTNSDYCSIQIEKRRELQFGSYDQFHHECIVCFLGVPTEVWMARVESLRQLSKTAVEKGIRGAVSPAPPNCRFAVLTEQSSTARGGLAANSSIAT